MNVLERIHDKRIVGRRAGVLAGHLAELLPREVSVLDIGAGDGLLAALVLERRPDLVIRGIDVEVREGARIPVEAFDGRRIPLDDAGVDVAMVVDVLHHTSDPAVLLRESARVARDSVVIKDHTVRGPAARATLRLMDWVGNARHGVALPYNYWTEGQWRSAFADAKLTVAEWRSDLSLYPWPADWIFGRSLHYLTRLVPSTRA